MDAGQFDRLVKGITASGSRREALRILAALPLAGVPALLAAAESAGKRLRHGCQASHRPGKDKDNCKGKRKGHRKRAQASCTVVLREAGCTLGRVDVAMVWTCPANTNLENADLSHCDLAGVRMNQVLLNDASFNWSTLNKAQFNGAQMRRVHLDRAMMLQATFRQAKLGGAIFPFATMTGADFTGADLTGASLKTAKMVNANFQDADLSGVDWFTATCPDSTIAFTGTCCNHLNGHTPAHCG